jgi:ribulose-phosphate 3-epimerase
MKRILPSILPIYNSKNKKQELELISDFIHHVHFDVMDSFVNGVAFDENELGLLSTLGIKSSVHLMVNDPKEYFLRFKKYLVDSFTFHCEANAHEYNLELIKLIRNNGFKAGIAIKPNTDIKQYYKEVAESQIITIMTVEPGKGGQTFIKEALNKIVEIKYINPNVRIEVDGGINNNTIEIAKKYCDDFVVGSYFFNQKEKEDCYNNLLSLINN